MGRDTVGVLNDEVVGGKGYRIKWDPPRGTLVPLGEWTEHYIQSPAFKLWGFDARLTIDITQRPRDRQNVLMVIRLCLDPHKPKAWANICKGTKSCLSASYDGDMTLDNRKGEDLFKTLNSPNMFQLSFLFPLDKETGAPQMWEHFQIKFEIEKPGRECSLEVVKTSLDRHLGFQHLSSELGQLLANPEGSDLTIRCGNQEFPVHKFILSARSTTLKKMMGELKEDTLEIDKVKERSMDPEAVKEILEWIYTGQLNEKIEEKDLLGELRDLAGIWGLEELQSYVDSLIHFNNHLENPELDEEIETPPKKKSKTEKKDYNLVFGDLKVIPWESCRMEWTIQLPKLGVDVKKFHSPSVRFFGVDWSLLLKVSYNTKKIHAFKTDFQISLQCEPSTLLDHGFELGVEPKLIFDVKHNGPGLQSHEYWRYDGSDSYDESDNSESDEKECYWISKYRPKRVGKNAYKFSMNRLYEKGHEIKIDWTLKIDFDNWRIADKMKNKINSEIAFLEDLSLDLESLLDVPGEQDVVLRCEGKDFRAHKVILAAQSPVFKVMLETPMKEALESVVEVRDVYGELVDGDVVGALLRWMYTRELGELNEGQALITLGLADFYDLSRLMEFCQVKLKGLIGDENVVDILIMADLVGAKGLKRDAIQFINKNKSIAKLEEIKKKVGWDLFQDIWLDN